MYKVGTLELINGVAATADEKEAHAVPQGGTGWTYKKNGTDKLDVSDGTTTYTYALGSNLNDGSKVTDSHGELSFSALTKGYYFVEENLTYGTPQVAGNDVEITSKVKPFVAAIPMTAPDGESWLEDVHVYPKNEGLNPEKKAEVPSVNIGDEVKWSVTAAIPTDFSEYTAFSITDELDEKLNFVTNSVEIYGTEADGTTTVETLDGTNAPVDYTVTHTPADPSNKEKLVIALTKEGIAKLAANQNAQKLELILKQRSTAKSMMRQTIL